MSLSYHVEETLREMGYGDNERVKRRLERIQELLEPSMVVIE